MSSAPKTNSRRAFVKTCLGVAAAAVAQPSRVAWAEPVRRYNRTLLVDEKGQPIRGADVGPDQPFVFHYPYVTTPCFLINLNRTLQGGEPLATNDSAPYTWQGGAGPKQSIVAFSAICAHKLSYPTKTVSFLNYRPEPVRYMSEQNGVQQKSQLIYCCSERSAYDPARGAAVLGGPASQPLAAVELEYDPDADQFHAIGTRGGELYEPFFEKFGFRLALDHKLTDVRAAVEGETTVYPHADYSKQAFAC